MPSANTPMLALADRVERAECPSRDLDAEIHRAIHPEFADMIANYPHCGRGWLVGGNHPQPIEAPRYTASTDAALTLVPEGWAWSVQHSDSCEGDAWLYPPNNYDDIGIRGHGKIAPMAIVAAALRARAAAAGGSDGNAA